METVGFAVLVIGVIVCAVGYIMIVVAAFKESFLWGLGILFFNPVILVFVILNWSAAGKGFLTYLAGAGIAVAGMVLIAASAPDQAKLKQPPPKPPVTAPASP